MSEADRIKEIQHRLVELENEKQNLIAEWEKRIFTCLS